MSDTLTKRVFHKWMMTMNIKVFEVYLYNHKSGDSRTVEVEAKSKREAEHIANDMFYGFLTERVKDK